MPDVPSRSWYDPVLGAWLHTGVNARDAVTTMPSTAVAVDIETPGLHRAFEVNCVTAAWRQDGTIHSVLLDPCRQPLDTPVVRDLMSRATALILHNAPFDIPALHHHRLLTLDEVNKVVDTLLLARFAFPGNVVRKSLGDLAVSLLGWEDFKTGMDLAFKAAGYPNRDAGYINMDIDSPVYRMGAMADTVATLLLEPILREKCIALTLDHPFRTHGATTKGEAEDVLAMQEVVGRVMLRRTAVGIVVNTEYLDSYREKHDDRTRYAARLSEAGLEGGSGRGIILMDYLASIGELPANWPRTATGKLKATKDLLANLDHPLAEAQRMLAETDKILGYLEKVAHQAATTGRCHPQVSVLGASQTGRMAASVPEYQQFPKEARPIFGADTDSGLTSIDWSQIEPVTMGLLAGDRQFLAPFEDGEDLYEPIQRACGVDRTTAKVVLLAAMYGQGTSGMARRIGHTDESAAQIRRQMLEAMPKCGPWMRRVQTVAEDIGLVLTAGRRILPVERDWASKAVNWTVQGSAYDILAATIAEMDRQGVGDSLVLAMHDEVVVGTEVAELVQKIMETPPQFLCDRAGRVPVLRTDRADLGHAWAKV